MPSSTQKMTSLNSALRNARKVGDSLHFAGENTLAERCYKLEQAIANAVSKLQDQMEKAKK